MYPSMRQGGRYASSYEGPSQKYCVAKQGALKAGLLKSILSLRLPANLVREGCRYLGGYT